MPMENQLAHAITQTEYDSSYDKAAKKRLANKQILAQIMKGCVNEYSDCTVDDIVGMLCGRTMHGSKAPSSWTAI